MPFKANADRRRRIFRQGFKVTNWRDYDASLRGRGSLTVWFTEEAIASSKAEPRTTRGGQPTYSGMAILTASTLRAVFRLALRQTEGLIGSIMKLLGLAGAYHRSPAPLRHGTGCRRYCHGAHRGPDVGRAGADPTLSTRRSSQCRSG